MQQISESSGPALGWTMMMYQKKKLRKDFGKQQSGAWLDGYRDR